MNQPKSQFPVRKIVASLTTTKGKRGQILVAMAIIVPVLVAVAALGVDIAVFYFNWAGMQAAADNAALAGVAYLPNDTKSAQSAATSYAVINGALATEVAAPSFTNNNYSMTVTISRDVPFKFARVLGMTSSTVNVSATATLMTTSSASGALPIGITSQTTYANGQSIVLHNGRVGAGNWDGLALGCSGGACFSNNLANGYAGTLTLGQVINSEPGMKVGPTSSGITQRVANGMAVDPSGTWASHTLTDPRVAIVPVVNWAGCNGSCSVPIVAFATIWVVSSSGGDINAVFIASVAQNATPASGASNYGVFQAVLTK